jgi:hypothetical protein
VKKESDRNGFHTTAPDWMDVFSTVPSMEEVSASKAAAAINDDSEVL